jgi:hypothetical protein
MARSARAGRVSRTHTGCPPRWQPALLPAPQGRILGLRIELHKPGSTLDTRTSRHLLRPPAQLPSVDATSAAPCAARPYARTIAGAVRPLSLPHYGATWQAPQRSTRERRVLQARSQVTARDKWDLAKSLPAQGCVLRACRGMGRRLHACAARPAALACRRKL